MLDTEALARRLEEAHESREPLPPPSESEGLDSVETAYAVQTGWERLRIARGDEIVGRKIGLTSLAMQEQLGVDEPDYGALWASRRYTATGGAARIPLAPFIEPRLEGEIAFLLHAPLEGPDVTREQVLSATRALALSVEVIDSRIADWKIKLVDTIADNASFGGFVTGEWSGDLLQRDLAQLELTVERNGAVATEGLGSAVLGHPAEAVAWLANKLSGYGTRLEADAVILSGSLGPAVPIAAGDTFVLRSAGQPPLTVSFA